MIIGDYLTKSELLRRGWSAAKIPALLGKPDRRLPPVHDTARWMHGYHRDRVNAAERTGECWKRGITHANHNPDAAAQQERHQRHQQRDRADEQEARRWAEYAASENF